MSSICFYLDRWDVEENSYHRKTPKLPSIYAWVPHWSLLKDILTITQGTPSRERFKADFDTMRVFWGRLQRKFQSLVLQPVTFATAFSLASHAARFLASKGLLCKEKQVLLNIQKMWFYEKHILVCATRTCVTFDRCLSFPGAVCSMLSSCNCYQRNWTWPNASKWPYYNDSETRSLS